MILLKPSATIEDKVDGPAILRKIEAAGRTCYKSEIAHDKKVGELIENDRFAPDAKGLQARADAAGREVTEDFVRRILGRGHESVIEHVSVTVRIICDRGVTHEIVRHRLAAYSQESTRYVNYGKRGCQFIIPPWCKDIEEGVYGTGDLTDAVQTELVSPSGKRWHPSLIDSETERLEWRWLLAMSDAEAAYLGLTYYGWTPQQARSVLPNSTKTEIVMTCNLREWRHIMRIRAVNKAAHPQMREVMLLLLAQFKARIPVLFDEFEVEA